MIIWSREMDSAILSRFSPLVLHTQAEYDAYSRDSSRFPCRRSSILLTATQVRTDGVNCRKSVGTWPLSLFNVESYCEQSELLIYKGHHFFSGVLKKIPTRVPAIIKGKLIEGDLIGQWLQSYYTTSVQLRYYYCYNCFLL